MKVFVLIILLGINIPTLANTEIELRRMIQANPNNIQAYADLIELATTREKINQLGTEAIKAVGERFQIYTALGNAYMNAQDFNNAINAYRLAISLNPRSATGYNRLGVALMKISYFRQAETSFKAAVAYSPANTPANLNYKANLGSVYESLKDTEATRQIILEILAINSSHPQALALQERIK